MADTTPPAREPQDGAPPARQPGVSDAHEGSSPDVRPEDLQQVEPHEVAEPPTFGTEAEAPRINADLLDDPDEVAETIKAASGEDVAVVSEEEMNE